MVGTCFSYCAPCANRAIYQEEKRKSRNCFPPLKPYITSTASSILLQLHFTMNKHLGTGNSPTLPTSYSIAELPSMFSSFFSAKIPNLRDKLDQTPLQPRPADPYFTGTPLSCFHPVSEIEVLNTLKSMSFKPCEPDPIPAFCLL